MIVDDYDDARELLSVLVASVGWRPVEARSGFEAITLANRVRPSLILMDLSMPGMDGLETTRRLKADPRTSEVPVIAVTAHLHLDKDAQDSGCATVLRKPCSPDKVLSTIAHHLSMLSHV